MARARQKEKKKTNGMSMGGAARRMGANALTTALVELLTRRILRWATVPVLGLCILVAIDGCTDNKAVIDTLDSVNASGQERNDSSRSGMLLRCTPEDKPQCYVMGGLPCTRDVIKVSRHEQLEIHFKVTNRDASNPYERGYRELIRYRNNKAVEKVGLRRSDDPTWNSVSFVRVRRQSFLADLDGDGHLEFAVFPFSAGSAIWGTARIYSLKEKIEFWGNGKYLFEELDGFVKLDCMKCSKFRPEECNKCR